MENSGEKVEDRHLQVEQNLEEFKKKSIEAANSTMGVLRSAMGDEGFSKWIAFNNKWNKFKKEGRDREADLLKEKYLKDNG